MGNLGLRSGGSSRELEVYDGPGTQQELEYPAVSVDQLRRMLRDGVNPDLAFTPHLLDRLPADASLFPPPLPRPTRRVRAPFHLQLSSVRVFRCDPGQTGGPQRVQLAMTVDNTHAALLTVFSNTTVSLDGTELIVAEGGCIAGPFVLPAPRHRAGSLLPQSSSTSPDQKTTGNGMLTAVTSVAVDAFVEEHSDHLDHLSPRADGTSLFVLPRNLALPVSGSGPGKLVVVIEGAPFRCGCALALGQSEPSECQLHTRNVYRNLEGKRRGGGGGGGGVGGRRARSGSWLHALVSENPLAVYTHLRQPGLRQVRGSDAMVALSGVLDRGGGSGSGGGSGGGDDGDEENVVLTYEWESVEVALAEIQSSDNNSNNSNNNNNNNNSNNNNNNNNNNNSHNNNTSGNNDGDSNKGSSRVVRHTSGPHRVSISGKVYSMDDIFGMKRVLGTEVSPTTATSSTTGGAVNQQSHIDREGWPTEVKSPGAAAAGSDSEGVDDEESTCVICMTDPPTTVLLPCRHYCVCSDCCPELVRNTNKCPICRSLIEGTLCLQYNGSMA